MMMVGWENNDPTGLFAEKSSFWRRLVDRCVGTFVRF